MSNTEKQNVSQNWRVKLTRKAETNVKQPIWKKEPSISVLGRFHEGVQEWIKKILPGDLHSLLKPIHSEDLTTVDIMETVGFYEYNSKDLIGHGAFAVVYRGRVKMVRSFNTIKLDFPG